MKGSRGTRACFFSFSLDRKFIENKTQLGDLKFKFYLGSNECWDALML